MKKRISIIVAVAKNWAIGKDNDLLWHISEDLKWFKKNTSGNPVIMGKNTWDSLPLKPLPKRINIIISDNSSDVFEGGITVNTVEAAIQSMDPEKENFIIGGGSIYRQFLPKADHLYLTMVHEEFEGDVYFPEVDFEDWEEIFKEDHPKSGDVPLGYSFVILRRKAK
jgi:dihydrofolate reductase